MNDDGILGSGINRSTTIYRIVNQEKLFGMLSRRENVLVQPRKWSDPYEDILGKARLKMKDGRYASFRTENVFAQCWTMDSASDAMWQLYSKRTESQAVDGVRMRTTVGKLLDSIREIFVGEEFRCLVGRVKYLKDHEIVAFGKSHFTNEQASPSEAIAGAYLIKRRPFRHEREVRLVSIVKDSLGEDGLFCYQFDFNNVIDQIMAHPQMPHPKFIELKSKLKLLGYKGSIRRSLLYAPPKGFEFTFGKNGA